MVLVTTYWCLFTKYPSKLRTARFENVKHSFAKQKSSVLLNLHRCSTCMSQIMKKKQQLPSRLQKENNWKRLLAFLVTFESRSWQCKVWRICGCSSSPDPAMIPAAMNYAWDPGTHYPSLYAILITLLKLPLDSYEYVEKCLWPI